MGAGAASATPEPTGGPEVSTKSVCSNTLYAVLNVSRTATMEEITAAYRKLALAHHPDRPNGSQSKFQEIQRAYEVLSQKDARATYDVLLRGRLAMQNFKRPPPLESVLQPVYALLADGAFYEFEAAPSKLKCSIHYGDGIQFNNDCGSFIGLAGDGFIYWTISGRGFASRLCKAGSSFALSSVRVMYRSNMGLLKVPLKRSSLWSSLTRRPADSSGSKRAVKGKTVDAGSSERARSAIGAPAAKMSEADRIKRVLLNKERSRNLQRRMEMLKEEEAVDRNYLQQDLWGQFSSLHTTAEAAFRCTLQGIAVPVEMALWMGYKSPEEVMLRSSDACTSPLLAEQVSLQDSFWIDPLRSDYYSDDEVLREDCDDKKEDSRNCTTNGGDNTARSKSGSADRSPFFLQSMPAFDAAPDGGACHGHSATAPETHSPTLHRFKESVAAVTGASNGTEVEGKKVFASPSSPPPRQILPIESSGEAVPLHPTSDSCAPLTSQPSCAANGPVKKLGAKEVAPLTGLKSNSQPHSSGLHTSAESGELASSSLGVSSRATGRTVRAAARAERHVAVSDSAAASPSRNVGGKQGRSLRAGSKAATAYSHASPQKVSITETPTRELSKGQKACPLLPRRKHSGSGVGDAMLPVRLASALEEKPKRVTKGNDAVLSNDKNLSKKEKGQTRPRWMMATEAYERRANLPLEKSLNAATQGSSFCHEDHRAYKSLTADQLFEEERAFMESFSKTKRIV
ncbi:putative DNAJ domain protein [Leishmania mexicana MHOM/GT/2001/U1103]|uniref:DNAJ domain protein n=1 Tax=Leishmania mexicana (strain MHOM/GT/2001/U1103) TaxID=929439 RepID=E9B0V1_LEIMU|nr:putative DNAJ domain protein [Leishmania mexicana MHOM/GT/2001/U1103]CBZ28856.1 putative DNAJ domain protein [Leishmania mexicana MHOM/GT/2001/U1103]